MEIPRSPISAVAVVAVLLVAAACFTLGARDLPLVRNSLVYARASEHVIEHGYDPRPVVADSKLSYDKPILYAWFSAPFVAALGNHDGLRVTSFLTTALFLAALLHFARSFRSELPPGGDVLVVWLGGLGACVFYQFWSAHPDGWFAALAVFAWSLAHRLVNERDRDPRRRVLVLGATILIAILLKNYGLVLALACPLYWLVRWRELRVDRAYFLRFAATSVVVWLFLGAFVALAATGTNPLSRLEGEGGGVGQYGNGELAKSAGGACVAFAIALCVQFHVGGLAALHPRAWSRRLVAPLACFGGTYVVGLLPFPTTFYNMRYFVPLFALAALPVARGLCAVPPSVRRVLVGAHALLAVGAIVVFNSAPAYRLARPYVPALQVNWIGVPLSLLDNLRMPLHLDQANLLAHVNANVGANATLYWLDVGYYRDAQHGVYERAGLVRPDIESRYASSRDFHPAETSFYVWSASPRSLPAEFASAEDLGLGLRRVSSR